MTKVALESIPKWTPVTTRVPSPRDTEKYLVTDRKLIWVETTHPSWWNYRDKRGREHNGPKITHWMRLPRLPR